MNELSQEAQDLRDAEFVRDDGYRTDAERRLATKYIALAKENASLLEQRKRVLALFRGSSLVDSSIYADICEIYEVKAE